jgi:hypothetical protein
MTAKVYTTKGNANRAAKAAGVDPATVYATEGGFTFPTVAPASNATESTSANPPGWEFAGGPTDQESGPASNEDPAFAAKFAANMAEIDSQLATLGNGPATESGAPVVALVEDPARHVVVGGATETGQEEGIVARVVSVGPATGPMAQDKPAKAARGKGKGKGKAAKPAKPAKAAPAKGAKGKPGRKPKAPAEPKAPRDTKLSRFVAMLRRPEGCTLDDAMDASRPAAPLRGPLR